jgi:hypothetical protein
MKTRKELKEEYKQLKFRVGVFRIRNTVTGNIYVDSSVNLDAIWNRHRMQLNVGVHPNEALQAEWKAFGEEKFVYEIVDVIEQKGGSEVDYAKEAKALELLYVVELGAHGEKGYGRRKPE